MQRRPAREAILEAFISLLDEQDIDKVTVRMLCKTADIARSTFYMHFNDIYEVIQVIEDDLIDAFKRVDIDAAHAPRASKCPGKLPRTRWGFPLDPPESFYTWFDVCIEHKRSLKAMLGPHGDPYFVAKFRRGLTTHVSIMMDLDEMPKDELRRGFTESMVEVHFILLCNWLLHEQASLTMANIALILNAMRIGGNTIGYYGDWIEDHVLDE